MNESTGLNNSNITNDRVPTQIRRERSPDTDDSVHAGERANVNVNRFSMPKDPRELIYAAGLALSIIINIALGLMYRYDAQERDLDRYDDTQRQEKVDKELSDLRAKIEVTHELIQAYGLQNATRDKIRPRQ